MKRKGEIPSDLCRKPYYHVSYHRKHWHSTLFSFQSSVLGLKAREGKCHVFPPKINTNVLSLRLEIVCFLSIAGFLGMKLVLPGSRLSSKDMNFWSSRLHFSLFLWELRSSESWKRYQHLLLRIAFMKRRKWRSEMLIITAFP